jgi:hypothetical protein
VGGSENIEARIADKFKPELASTLPCATRIRGWKFITVNGFCLRNARQYRIELRLGRKLRAFGKVFLGHKGGELLRSC